MNTDIKTKQSKLQHSISFHTGRANMQTHPLAFNPHTYDNQKMQTNLVSQISELTKNLITAHSTSDNLEGRNDALMLAKRELAEYPMEEFERGGYRSLLVRNNSEATRKFKIILNAHLDVMPGSIEQFEPYLQDGKLYGRGAYDMKGAAAVMILLFRYLAKHLPYPIALQLTTDEEVTGKHCTKFQLEQGVRSDFVITGECGSNFQIVNKAKGILWFKLHTTGVSAHGAYPWKGENALWKLQHALNALQEMFPVPEKEDWVTTMNLAKIETSNTRFNHVPDGATAYVDIRFIAEEEKELLEKITQAMSSEVTMEIITHEPPQFIADDNPFLVTLQKSITETTGTEAKLIEAHAPSDIRHYNTVGCHGVEFGPVGYGQHENNEWVDLKSLEKYFFGLETYLIDAIKI